MNHLESLLELALVKARNERELQPFLKQYPLLIRNALNVWAWNYVDVLPEFRFGSDFRADFLILSADSGSWHATLVELKSHRSRLFTKQGLPSRSLNTALRQLDDWELWLRRYENLFRASLSKHFESKKVIAFCSPADRHRMAETEITDPRTRLDLKYRILMGRRNELDIEDQERRGLLSAKGRDIVTYDRLIDVARTLDAAAQKVPSNQPGLADR